MGKGSPAPSQFACIKIGSTSSGLGGPALETYLPQVLPRHQNMMLSLYYLLSNQVDSQALLEEAFQQWRDPWSHDGEVRLLSVEIYWGLIMCPALFKLLDMY